MAVAGRVETVVGRDDVVRRRVCRGGGEELAISLRDILDCLAVVLYVPVELEVMRSRHLDAEVALRFIVALALPSCCIYISLPYTILLYRKVSSSACRIFVVSVVVCFPPERR